MVYLGTNKVDHLSESGLLFSVVAQAKVGTDYTAKNTCRIRPMFLTTSS
jgi:hypothetical protein